MEGNGADPSVEQFRLLNLVSSKDTSEEELGIVAKGKGAVLHQGNKV